MAKATKVTMNLLAHGMSALVKLYTYGISPILPGTCRYSPTCSAYALEAIDQFGPLKGAKLALARICRCHPWGGSGYDPVPEHETHSCGCESAHHPHDLDSQSRHDQELKM